MSESPIETDQVFGDLKSNYIQVNEAITALSKNIDSLSSNNIKLENKVNSLSKSIESSLSQPKPPAWEFPTSFTPSSVAINVADELSERNKRKCNVVVHNLPEPSAATNESDTSCFADICRRELGLKIEITKSIRLGQKQNSKPRSLLIKLSSEALRNKVLSLAPKLRFSSTWYQIYIQPDMTPTEREAYRKLQEELKRRKTLGEKNLIIRNGKIIQYEQKSFRTRVLTNNLSVVSENRDAHPPVASESQNSSATNKTLNQVSTIHDDTSVKAKSNDAYSTLHLCL